MEQGILTMALERFFIMAETIYLQKSILNFLPPHHTSKTHSPPASEIIAAYTVPHTHTQRLIERRQSMRYALPRVPTHIDFFTAVARGHRRRMKIIVHLLGISSPLCRSRPLSQHTSSTNSLTLKPGPAMTTGFLPPRQSPLRPPPPEFPIGVQTDIDKVLEIVIVAHVVSQGFAVVDGPRVQSLFKVIIQASAAVVTRFVVFDDPVSARSADSVP